MQHVDVCMFSNGKFKNTVATEECSDVPIPGNGGSLEKEYLLYPIKARTKNWIALEDSLGSTINKCEGSLSSTVVCVSPEDRNVFAIYVTYYVKVKLLISAMGGQMSLKLPFTLMHMPSNAYPPSTGITRQRTDEFFLNFFFTLHSLRVLSTFQKTIKNARFRL